MEGGKGQRKLQIVRRRWWRNKMSPRKRIRIIYERVSL